MDHFKAIFEPSWVRWAHLGGFFLFHGLGSYLLISVIRYENERTRNTTIIHSLTKFLYVLPILHNMTRLNLDVARSFYGPLPNYLCMASMFFNSFVANVALLAFNEIMVLRYLYICVWKNVGKLNDEFFSAFLAVGNFFLGCYLSVATMMSQNFYTFHFGVCNGEDPSSFDDKIFPLPATPRLAIIFGIFSGFFHCILYAQIIQVKVKSVQPVPKISSGDQANTVRMKVTLSSHHQQIFKEVGQNVLMVLLILASLLPGSIVRHMDFKPDLYRQTWTQLLILSPNFVVPCVHTLIYVSCYVYCSPSSLRASLSWYDIKHIE